MVEKVFKCLIFSVVVCVLVYIIFWVATSMGLRLPDKVELGVWIVTVLIILLYWWRAFGGSINLDPKT